MVAGLVELLPALVTAVVALVVAFPVCMAAGVLVVAKVLALVEVDPEPVVQSVLFGPALRAHSPQLAQGINNELVH